MGTLKSLTSGFVFDVFRLLLTDISRLDNRAPVEVERDINYVTKRFESEGLSFLTVTLPSLGRALDAALATSEPFVCPTSFATCKGALPRFMGDVFGQLFGDDGKLSSDPSPAVVRTLRQVCYLLYKLELDFESDVVDAKIQEFLDLDRSLPDPAEGKILSRKTKRIVEYARLILVRVLDVINVDPDTWEPLPGPNPTGKAFDPSDIVPRHGPGAVATGERAHEKYVWRRWYKALDKEYPYEDYFYFNLSHFCDWLTRYCLMTTEAHGYAKLCAVPKDSRGPRLISMEPLEYQWIQQGLGRALSKFVESHGHTRDFVHFTDQTVNRDLALYASMTGEFDTLDMKDASDRVSLWLVRQLFPPRLLKKFEAARTAGTQVGRERHDLRKFAPMGSALCFPVEALVFWSLAVATLNIDHSASVWRDPRGLPAKVWVFGDDLIVPHGALDHLSPVFEELDLKFNTQKCCTGKYFRESCGMDAFRGVDVTPVRLRHLGESPNDLVSICEYARAFTQKGLPNLAEFLYSWVERSQGPLPFTSDEGRPLHRWCADGVMAQVQNLRRCAYQINVDLHQLEYRGLAPKACQYKHDGPDWAELWRCMRDPEEDRIRRVYGVHKTLWITSPSGLPADPCEKRAPWESPRVRPEPSWYTITRKLEIVPVWYSVQLTAEPGLPSPAEL